MRVLDELAASGLLSDARFAAALVHQKTGSHSKRAIAHALREKGVDADEATAALAALDGDDELAAAHALWARRFGEPPRDEREKARQVRFLLSRGYSHSIGVQGAAGRRRAESTTRRRSIPPQPRAAGAPSGTSARRLLQRCLRACGQPSAWASA